MKSKRAQGPGPVSEQLRPRMTASFAEPSEAITDATRPERYLDGELFDLVFADPPYEQSFAAFRVLASGKDENFFPAFPGARAVWELPDSPGSVGSFIEHAENNGAAWKLRRFGGTDFLWIN